ncbi:dihydrodipicolinate synthase family protein [Oceanispirochaeta crateris]|uniref:Dihydrodipicolinate synthase family protein n=1 Tax=Oceanispirochaeta crateris TaxID=2518645 RepID=A0A5C1QSB5_9SPIO|nr:dihydrodipicolinate synthase family protein [Oceanispirochaeta crateris]QEN09476.1 dihydrodipicolinate synthase family protein [Oceanispirochaeta crateris]
MDTAFIKGIIPPIVTPITKDEKIDENALRNLVDFLIEGGCSGILAFGSNGEFYMMEENEMEEGLKIIIDQTSGRVPVYMGIGSIRTSKCIRIARMGVRCGARSISILQPMFIKPTDDELKTHIRSIAESVPDVPVLLYNNPGRTGYAMSQDLVEDLAHTVPNLVGMKDSSGDLTQTIEFIRRNADVNFKVMCGKDTLIYSGLGVGAVGAVCSTANYAPKLVTSIYEKYVSGDIKGSLEAQFALNPIRLIIDKSSFPVATKDYANLVGTKVGVPFLPNKPSPPEQMECLKQELVKGGFSVVD